MKAEDVEQHAVETSINEFPRYKLQRLLRFPIRVSYEEELCCMSLLFVLEILVDATYD